MPHPNLLGRDVQRLTSTHQPAAIDGFSGVLDNVETTVMETPSRVWARAASSTTASSAASSHTCAKNDNSAACEKPVSSSTLTMPIVLSIVIPVSMALVIFFFLHRRHLRKLRAEDETDKHKSLDFGMGEVGLGNKQRGGEKSHPEMSKQDAERALGRNRGVSLDMGANSPYLLPPGLQSSRESLHSLSRSLNGEGDPYRPATTFPNVDGQNSSYSPSIRGDDDSSLGSRRGYPGNESRHNLLGNNHRMSRGFRSPSPNSPNPAGNSPVTTLNNGPSTLPRMPLAASDDRLSSIDQSHQMPLVAGEATVKEMNRLGGPLAATSSPPPLASAAASTEAVPRKSPPQATVSPAGSNSPPRGLPANPRPVRDAPRASSPVTVPNISPFASEEDAVADAPPVPSKMNEKAPYDFDSNFRVDPPPMDQSHPDQGQQHDLHHEEDNFGYDTRRLTIRPLPPDDPSENPAHRASRIRSFYKEYFDESNTNQHVQDGPVDYQEDYGAEFSTFDTPLYDPDQGRFITPFAEPIARRAMTPPPRAPPRFQAGPRRPIPSAGSDSFRAGPRAMSSTSNRFGPSKPVKKAPPPAPLTTLPTPHMLKDDSLMLADFAPPQSMNDRMTGSRPDSPLGSVRPYSPSLRPQRTLVSSFDDLALMPSPHALRKSGTFTSLDFAPPGRFRGQDTASDAGSIRSNRSGMSAMHMQSIRAGAYRLSRVPKDTVGSRQDFTTSLRPTWDMRK